MRSNSDGSRIHRGLYRHRKDNTFVVVDNRVGGTVYYRINGEGSIVELPLAEFASLYTARL